MPNSEQLGVLDRELITDIIRFSDGAVDPNELANEQLRQFLQRSVENCPDMWGDRLDEVCEKYAPHTFAEWEKHDQEANSAHRQAYQPLVWKEVSVVAGSQVRMSYGGRQHYATVKNGRIVDDSGDYSPSEWARKVAGDTSRNAWRDLWFKEPTSQTWVPAQLLRDQAQERLEDLARANPL